MRKVVLYIAMSLDGYIASKEGSVEFLDDFQNLEEGDYGYNDFVTTIDTCIMGSKTYKSILGFGYSWPYMDQHTYVITTNSGLTVNSPLTSVLSEDINNTIELLKKQSSDKDIWLVGGGNLVQYFLNNNLLDKMILTITPKILGEGIRLFPEGIISSNWKVTEHLFFESGMTILTYEKTTSYNR